LKRYNPEIHHRRSIRLKGYDYSQAGAYFITICTENRRCLFGMVEGSEMILNRAGEYVKECWLKIPEHFPHAKLDEFSIMPNHIHGIIIINENVGVHVGVQDFEPLHNKKCKYNPLRKINKYQQIIPKSIGSIVRGFKIGVTKWFRQNTDVYNVWQRNYYEHIIRNENELNKIREYIINNPIKWAEDKNNPVNIRNK